MKYLLLAILLSLATVANATNNNDCPGNSCHGGDAAASANATGGSAKAEGGDAHSSSNSGAVSGSVSGATAKNGDQSQTLISNPTAIATGGQGGEGGKGGSATGVGVSGASSNLQVDDHSTSDWTEVSDAPATTGASAAIDNICGNVTGVSAGVGIAGGGFNRPSAGCIIHKHELFQRAYSGAPAVFEFITFWASSPVVLSYAVLMGAP
jgi:hypothetical protein